MQLDLNEDKFVLIPCQVIEIENGIILKKGITQLKIEGEIAFDFIKLLIHLGGNEGVEEHTILEYFNEGFHDILKSLLAEMKGRGFWVKPEHNFQDENSNDEFRLNILNWNLGLNPEQTQDLINTNIIILGVNVISRQLTQSLKWCGFKNVQVVDVPILRNIDLFQANGQLLHSTETAIFGLTRTYDSWLDNLETGMNIDCIVCTSDFGGHQLMRDFNKFSVENNVPFLPVVLNNMQGMVGPFVIPNEGPCLECLIGRLESNNDNYTDARVIEMSSFEGQQQTGFHPSMATILGDISALEIYKFFGKVFQTWNIGTLIEVNLLRTMIKSRKVLKLPRCTVCSKVQTRSAFTVFQSTFMSTHED